MIYNRTYIDIINARKIFTNKIQKFLALTEEEQETIDKAFFNTTAINRITSKMSEIWDEIVSYGGKKQDCEDVREWNRQEIFTVSNFANIKENISFIINRLFVLNLVDTETYELAYQKLTLEYVYTNLNNLEKLIFDIHNIFQKFQILISDELYIVGAYKAEQSGEVLTIE